ncbi:hypothetical protein MNV49_007984 [Pseudohyphozyma bogoriensis]|nr:hypothetical protein MNV49_007984 [Pseudohyphozyma bogoriensis]
MSKLSKEQAVRYLNRIGLDASLVDATPSLELLNAIHFASLQKIPFESSMLHLPADVATLPPDTPIKLGGGDTIYLGEPTFERICGPLNAGSLCFGLNGTLASCLRAIGFRVSEAKGLMNGRMGKNPSQEGFEWKWAGTTHSVLVVDWEGSQSRYIADLGFGGAQSHLCIELKDGARGESLDPKTAFKVTYGPLPHHDLSSVFPDSEPRYTYWRWETTQGDVATVEDPSTGYWWPLFSFLLQSVNSTDLEVASHYACTHRDATFTSLLMVNVYKPGGGFKNFGFRRGGKREGYEGEWAQFEEDGPGEETREYWVEMKTGPLVEVLTKEFGFRF